MSRYTYRAELQLLGDTEFCRATPEPTTAEAKDA
jgi:hypothetical protein